MPEEPPNDDRNQLNLGMPSYDFGDEPEDDEEQEEEDDQAQSTVQHSEQVALPEAGEVEVGSIDFDEVGIEEPAGETEGEEVRKAPDVEDGPAVEGDQGNESDVVKKESVKKRTTAEASEPIDVESVVMDDEEELGESHGSSGGGDPPMATISSYESDPDDSNPLRKRVDKSFLEYASYVIRDRAIPHLIDGLKPVQRRIMWSVRRNDDGKFIKVANIVGYTMQFHPHGDASIGDALVVLTNKRYLIEGQGNFGNIFTGDRAAASRYIECRLTELARTQLFNDELTEFIPSYDGRNKEPVVLPSKLPLLLMLGAEGIAVGLSCKILPHNFIELLEAQIDILRKKPIYLVPDFPVNCQMDSSQYDDGRGNIRLRARIEIKSENTLLITAISPTSTTDSLINSIEDASRKGKIKVKSISDYTAEKIEIEIKLPPGVKAEKTIPALYAFTDCETSISSRIIVIRENRPVEMSVTQILRFNTMMLKNFLEKELKLAEAKLNEELHFKTLVQIFVENRIYKRIEDCKTNEKVVSEIYIGFEPFKKKLIRNITDADIEKLLAVHIRRISLFDINKHQDEMEKLLRDLAEVRKNLGQLTRYTVRHLKELIK
ncbi:hypothetical protein N9059_01705, partial [bacterium]|nr:hypothetical protein [bacterium]